MTQLESLKIQNEILQERNIELKRLLGLNADITYYGMTLAPIKRRLLSLLMRGKVVPTEIAEAALPEADDARIEHLLYVHMAQLRKKLGDTAASPRWLLTIHGVGYKLADQ